ncbi:flippase [Bacillus infantis]|uniref:flippase n=1 Tax=Bacillus infantis TaxID=324767 RepID=UPI0039828E24
MNKLVQNYIYNIMYQVFLLVVPIVTAPYLARVLGAPQLGIYSYINSVSSIITTLCLLGLNNYGIRQIAYYQGDKYKQNRIFWEIMSARLILVIIVSAGYFFFIAESEYKIYFLIQYFLILSVFCDVSWFMIGLENMGIIVFRNFIAKFLTVVGTFIFVKDQSDLWIYLGLFSIITFFTTISLYPYIKKHVSWYRSNLKNILSHFIPSLLLFLPQVATLLYLQVDKVMLKFLTDSTSQIAFFDQADKIVQIPLALITALGTVMMPRLAVEFKKDNQIAIKSYLNKTLNFVLLMSFPMMFGIAGIASSLVPWYLGRDFLPVVSAIVIISPIIIFNSLNNISGTQYFTATNQTKILTIAYVSAAAINITINALFIPKFGYKGAAIATLISSLLSVIIQYRHLTRQIDIWHTILNGWKYLSLSIFMGILVYIIGDYLGATPLTTLLQLITGAVFYFLALLIVKDKMFMIIINRIKYFKF